MLNNYKQHCNMKTNIHKNTFILRLIFGLYEKGYCNAI